MIRSNLAQYYGILKSKLKTQANSKYCKDFVNSGVSGEGGGKLGHTVLGAGLDQNILQSFKNTF